MIERLREEGASFGFFQAVALLEEYARSQGVDDPIGTGRIQFRSNTDIVFPPGDIARIQERGEAVELVLSFMGLLGITSPLPTFFADTVSRDPEKGRVLSDFLAIFENRLYSLLYQAWRKYQLVNPSATTATGIVDKLRLLAGFLAGPPQEQDLEQLAYVGVVSGRSRSARGLATMISHRFHGIAVKVEEFLPKRVPLRNRPGLGTQSQLGVNTIIGDSILAPASRFRVVIGPLPRREFEQFRPGSPRIRLIRRMVDTYLADPLDYDIEVRLHRPELIPVVLGRDDAPLGRVASLGRGKALGAVRSVMVA